jgi:hypothetical protein
MLGQQRFNLIQQLGAGQDIEESIGIGIFKVLTKVFLLMCSCPAATIHRGCSLVSKWWFGDYHLTLQGQPFLVIGSTGYG